MITLFKSKDQQASSLSDFKDPFQKDCVDRITMTITKRPSIVRNGFAMEATVYLKSGNTEGSHEMYSNDFNDLVNQVSNFIKELK